LLEPRPRQTAQHGFGELANHDWFDRAQSERAAARPVPVGRAGIRNEKDGKYSRINADPIGIGDVSQEPALWRALRFDAGPAPRM
jgi:hypothetical protein